MQIAKGETLEMDLDYPAKGYFTLNIKNISNNQK